jgi:hypothetical protein
MHKYTIWFSPYDKPGLQYEIRVKCDDPHTLIPKRIVENGWGTIHEIGTPLSRAWNSLAAMTHDLKVEIIDFGSDVGD